MKKIATILLLGLLLFNWFGYRLLVACLQDRTSKTLEARLDNNDYDESQLLSIKTQVTHLSYYNASDQFERIDGSLEIGGVKYKYVKRRLFKDSAEFLCIPDLAGMKLQSFNNDFLRFASGISTPAKTTMADPYVVEPLYLTHHHAFIQLPKTDHYTLYFPSSPTSTPERPPTLLV